MAQSISIIEYKALQALFFLEQIAKSGSNFFAVQCFTDSFASACRSITFSMQSVMGNIDNFKEWYATKQDILKNDKLAQFFNAYRVASIHIGDTVVRAGSIATDNDGKRIMQYYFIPIPDVQNVPDEDVLSICRTYFTTLLGLVYNAFENFRYQLDDRWYYTEDNFHRIGKSIEDAEEDLGFPRGWTAVDSGFSESERWRVLRQTQTMGYHLNPVFQSYLGKMITGPDERTEQ
jgi:hypothetical protein